MQTIKNIVSIVILFCIIHFGNQLFPDYIQTNSVQTTIIVTLVHTAILLVTAVIIALISMIVAYFQYKLPSAVIVTYIILCAIICFALPLIGLYICSQLINGFAIHGMITYILIGVVLSVCTINTKSNKE